MRITDIRLGEISVPLITPFKTALRTVNSVEDIIVEIHTDTGNTGFGEAPPTGVITGDTNGAIIGAINDHIKKNIIGMDIENFEAIMIKQDKCIIKNTTAKAAVDIALYDLYGQLYNAPVYKLLGGYRKEIITDITISVNDPE
jgi:L-alanine-DL-glutamate epimerase-like enolase superfamily enzyme